MYRLNTKKLTGDSQWGKGARKSLARAG